MNDVFGNQKEKLLAIKQEISLLYQQVNYLLRNEKAVELLDLDVLMNRTHALYNMLCSIDAGEAPDDEDLPFDAEAFSGLFGDMMKEETEPEVESEVASEPEVEPEPMTEPEPEIEKEADESELVTEDLPAEPMAEPYIEPESEETPIEPEPMVETPMEPEGTTVSEFVEETPAEVEEPIQEPEPVVEESAPTEEKPLGDEFGFFFRFEDIPEEKPVEEKPQPVESTAKVVHVVEAIPEDEIPERDRVYGDDLVKDNPLEMPKMDDEIPPVFTELEEKRQGAGQVSDFFEPDDAGFELSPSGTLGEKMMGEDHSLAARLQQNPVNDLKSAIGINDKFLFVNELFGGSMEKYNKSIENLNDLKTLNGAMIYLNELKVELAWNSSNEAYNKLKDLIERKFEE